MEFLVDIVELVDRALCRRRGQALMDGFQLRALLGGDAARGQPGAQAFQFGHHLEHLQQCLDFDGPDSDALMTAQVDQSAGRQQPQGLAHRRARDAEALRDFLFIEPAAGRQRAIGDVAFETPLQAVGQCFIRLRIQCFTPLRGALDALLGAVYLFLCTFKHKYNTNQSLNYTSVSGRACRP